MINSRKKGFTLVELVIVIAVVAILAAVLIPTFSNLVRKANVSSDTALVKNLNTALAANVEGNDTMSEALESAKDFGFDVAKIQAKATGNKILWDSKNDCFVYQDSDKSSLVYIPDSKKIEPEKYDLWVISNKVDTEYSTYLYGENIPTSVTTNKGIDTGGYTVNVEYVNTSGNEQVVTISTNGGVLKVNAPLDSVMHYGESSQIEIIAIKDASFHEFGRTDLISITSGKVQVEAGATVDAIHAEGSAKLVVENNATVTSITQKNEGLLNVEGSNLTVEVKELSTVINETVKFEITTAEEFIQYITGNKEKGKLLNDIELKDVDKFSVINNLELDLNGHTIYLNDQGSRPIEIQAKVTMIVNGEREGSGVVITVESGSYGLFALKGNEARLILNGGKYTATMDNGSIVKSYAEDTYVEMNNLEVQTDNGMLYDFTGEYTRVKLVVNGGNYTHGYAVDNREEESTYGIECALANTINSEWNNVNVVSNFNQVLYMTLGTHTVNNCTFKIVGRRTTDNEFMLSVLGVAYEANVTVNGGTFTGKYGLVLYPSGYNFTNNGGKFIGDTYDYMQYDVTDSQNTVSGLTEFSQIKG